MGSITFGLPEVLDDDRRRTEGVDKGGEGTC
ncbi:hypothetical protein V6Z11_A07G231000 [Gossypium hirsutum]